MSLGESSQTQHRYQISRGQDGEVNIDVVVEDGEARGAERDIVIDNKDYNYTLIISGQNIQVIHHDTNRNLTYRHGLDVRKNASRYQTKCVTSGKSDFRRWCPGRPQRSLHLLQTAGSGEAN